MDEKQLRWIIAGVSLFAGLAYFVWLVSVFIKFQETDRYVRATIGEYFRSMDVPAPDGEGAKEE